MAFDDVRPDVVCLQETKLADKDFPSLVFAGLGYEAVHHGLNQWNGVAILSRVGVERPIDGFAPGIEPDADAAPHFSDLWRRPGA